MRPSRSEGFFIGLCLVVILFSFYYVGKIGVSWSRAEAEALERKSGPPNTLIVSVCSLRADLLSAYGHKGAETMPHLEKFFRHSTLQFANAFNGVPWIAFISFFERYFLQLQNAGIARPGPLTEFPFVRIPMLKSMRGMEFRDVNNSDYDKEYKEEFEYVRRSLMEMGNQPFLAMVHVKYMHYPLIDRFNPDSAWDYYLDDREKALLKEYLAHPEIYYKKLPFLLMLTTDPLYALAHPQVQKLSPGRDKASLNRLIGLVTNDHYLQEWKASSNFDADLAILKKIYQGNARYMDSHIVGPLLNLFGNKGLQANTAVIFSGDHGEVHMERDQLTHATSPFDEALRIPAAMRLPNSKRSVRVMEQVHIHTLADFTRDVALGEATAENASEKFHELLEDSFIMRNCTNTLHALRWKGKYKYIIDAASGQRTLYDLEKDPGELSDISLQNPEAAAQMESVYWATLPRFKWMPPYTCAPWDSQ